jgi:hypothetical protein
MSMSCLLFLTVYLYCTLFLTFYPVYHKTVQIPPNYEQFHNILFHNIFLSPHFKIIYRLSLDFWYYILTKTFPITKTSQLPSFQV